MAAPLGAGVAIAELRHRQVFAANPEMTIEELRDLIDGPDPTHPLVGLVAPALRGTTASGDDFADRRGSGVVVLWWASWCPPSLESLEVVQAASLLRDDLVFVTAAIQDDPEGIRAAIEAGGITVDVFDGSAHQHAWSVDGCPMTFAIEPDGTVGSLLAPYRTVEELLAQLRS